MLVMTFALLLQVTAPPVGEEPVAHYSMSNSNAGAKPSEDPRLFAAFHGKAGIDRVVDGFVQRNTADPRIADIFKGQDLIRLPRVLKEQFCYILGGGCAYSGRDMREAHRNMGLQNADMNAVVENLQASMSAERVPFWAQNKLLAKLAPMRHHVVER